MVNSSSTVQSVDLYTVSWPYHGFGKFSAVSSPKCTVLHKKAKQTQANVNLECQKKSTVYESIFYNVLLLLDAKIDR